MNKFKWLNNLLLYLSIVAVPTVLLTYLYLENKNTQVKEENQRIAQRYASLHAMHIDSFFGETIGRLETMALLINQENANLNKINELLKETHNKDARFSGFYWVSPEGDILLGSNPLTRKVNLIDRDYFLKAITTKKTSISEAHLGRVTGRYIVSVATPVVHNEQVLGVLIGSVRLDFLQEFLHRLLDQEAVGVRDDSGQLLISLGENKDGMSVAVLTTRIPWKVTVWLPDTSIEWKSATLALSIALSLVITHILYILIQYLRLRRQLTMEKLQDDAQKLELIGSLAASTAHEIRNPLTGIKGLTKLLSEKHQDPKDQFYFSVIQQEIDRINLIVSELLVLGKPTAQVLTNNNIHEIISEVAPLIESEAHLCKVQVVISPFDSPLYIPCSRNHIKQVILNLTKNALEAMPDGGLLTITVNKNTDQCTIIISDTGFGLSEESLKKIFNPFFTLKKHGTGLGLVVCKRIVEMHRGSISIRSQLGQGTEVEITLPLQ